MPNPLLQNENQELLVVEAMKEYSAGNGIDITSGVISLDHYVSASIDSKLASADFDTYSGGVAQDIAYVSANAGKTYYAGDNIGISDENVISSKDWTNDISNASAYAYNQAIAQIPAPQDLSYMSGAIDTNASDIQYISGVAITGHQDWTDTITAASSYAYNQATAQIPPQFDPTYMSGAIDKNVSDIQYISGKVDDKLDSTAFNLPNSAKWDESTDMVETNSGAWFDNVGDVNVNNYVYDNSALIDEVNSTYTTASGTYLTEHQDLSDYYTTANANTLSSMLSGAIDYVSGQVPAPVDLSYISGGVDYVSGVVGDKLDATAFNIPASSTWNDVSTNVQSNSSIWDDTTNVVQTNSSTWNNPGTSLTGDAQGAVDYVYTNSGDIMYSTGMSAYIPYSAIGVELVNSNFKIDPSGQAYKNESQIVPGATITGTYSPQYADTEFDWNSVQPNVEYTVLYDNAPQGAGSVVVYYYDSSLSRNVDVLASLKNDNMSTFTLPSEIFVNTGFKQLFMTYGDSQGTASINPNVAITLHQDTIVGGYVPYLTQTSANATYQPIGDYATTGDLFNTSGILSGAIDYVSANAGGSVDTIPVAVISPLVTGFSGESAYLGIESTALNLSSYVPVSSIGYNGSYISTISGNSISSYTGRYAMTANYANTADRAYKDRNSNEITSYYQPKLTIAGENGTITAINSSAVGATIPEGWELVAGAGIDIVDDVENNQTIISATGGGGGGNPEVEQVVQSYSAAGTWLINSDLSGYLTTGQYETDSAVFNAKQDALTFKTANAISTASNYGFTPITGISGINGSPLIIPMQAIQYVDDVHYTTQSAINRIYNKRIAADLDGEGNYIKDTYQKVSGVSANEWNSNYETVATNSGTWGGQSLPISAGAGIGLSMVDGVLVISVTGGN